MSLVKIVRSTIRRNPNGGRTDYLSYGPTRATFKFQGKNGLPPELLDKVTITQWDTVRPGDNCFQAGYINNPDDIAAFFIAKLNGLFIEVKTDIEQHHSFIPEPYWTYQHEDAICVCPFCEETFQVSEMAELDYGGDFQEDVCPHCREQETGGLEFESIGHVLKQLGI